MGDTADQLEAFRLKASIQRGDPAPWWNQGSYKFAFDPVGGRYIVLSFYGSARDAVGQAALCALHDHRRFVDEGKASFFCVASDPKDKAELNIDKSFPSLQFIWDTDATVNRAYGIGAGRVWIVLDPMLRVQEVIPFRADRTDVQQLVNTLEELPPPSQYLGFETPAPVLILPNVFEPEFCRYLIDYHEINGGRDSGFMQEVGGKAVEMHDPEWKRRKDYTITDEALIEMIKTRMGRRVGSMMQRTFQFKMSRMERHLIACYSAEDGGHFGPHRDDTVKATEHRRFAASINLNADFDGGEVSFPEFGSRPLKMPIGAALIFSASLLHRVSKITRGRRYVFVPFFHDEEAERVRQNNLQFLSRPA
jgi:predicted 2-oxoglutarate/Fe(II)-dependent dioxygenase YbiX/peroxiredoxin